MKKIYRVLIIENDNLMIDAYKHAFSCIEKEFGNILFVLDLVRSHDEMALNKIKKASKNNNPEMIFLEIPLSHSDYNKVIKRECLGVKINKFLPNTKVIVSTKFSNNNMLHYIIKSINPSGLIIKSDVGFDDIIYAIKDVLGNKTYYSQTVLQYFKNKVKHDIVLDHIDTLILNEISNGSKMKELLQLVPLTKSGIEKRKRLIKSSFKVSLDNDRDMIIAAKEKGFI
ncbi:hypothetical protein [Mariniflexile sp. HMF6888]|uniref:hypothetical protein n=1 Tax=Mariniflexile sp. HMF6888 TaxID=3373086 RepID=UPI0037BE04A3